MRLQTKLRHLESLEKQDKDVTQFVCSQSLPVMPSTEWALNKSLTGNDRKKK